MDRKDLLRANVNISIESFRCCVFFCRDTASFREVIFPAKNMFDKVVNDYPKGQDSFGQISL